MPRPRRFVPISGLLSRLATLAAVLLLPASLLVGTAPPAHAVPDVRFARAATGLRSPVGVVGSPAFDHRVHVLERRGVVRTYDRRLGRLLASNFLDLRDVVNNAGGEQGLLGMAFHPDWNGGRPLVYVAYTDADGALRVARLTASSPTATSVDAATLRQVLRVPHPTYTSHNGGQLLFGRDGNLYISTGDGGGAGDPLDNARDRTSLSGKILRIRPGWCDGRRYCIPADNPYATSTRYRREIWAYGMRNPWRFSQDPATGTLWIGDVGQYRQEEVSRIAEGDGGRNLGWPCREGRLSYDPSRCTGGTPKPPLIAYGRSTGSTVIGGYVYRGSAYRALVGGVYFFGDFESGRVWRYIGDGRFRTESHLPGLTSFGEDRRRELWAVTYDGALWRMVVLP